MKLAALRLEAIDEPIQTLLEGGLGGLRLRLGLGLGLGRAWLTTPTLPLSSAPLAAVCSFVDWGFAALGSALAVTAGIGLGEGAASGGSALGPQPLAASASVAAKASALLFGDAAHHREALANRIGL